MISGLVLAAGTSSRLGRTKQLLPLGGRPLVRVVVDAALAAGSLDEVVVVLGHDADRVAHALGRVERVRTTTNPDFARGQSSSLRAGLAAMGPDVEAAVVLLGDQPGIRSHAIDRVVGAYTEGVASVIQAAYSGLAAHPTLLARAVWGPLIEELGGDEGARGALRRHPEWRMAVEVGGRPPDDIDTEMDYQRLVAEQESTQ